MNFSFRPSIDIVCQDLRIKDLYLDEVVLRKVKRAEQAAKRRGDDTSDAESEEDSDSDVVIGPSTGTRKEQTRPHRPMEEIEED